MAQHLQIKITAAISISQSLNVLTWDDNRNGNGDIYLYEITTGVEAQVTNNSASQTNSQIATGDANFIVYMDNRNGNWDIYQASFGNLSV